MLKSLVHFYATLKSSLTDVTFYQALPPRITWSAVIYLFFLIYSILFIQTAVVVGYLAVQLPTFPEAMQSFQQRLADAYPDDLVISVHDGTLSINQESPVIIDMLELEDIEEFDHVVVLDMEAQAKDYDRYDSVLLMTGSELYYPQSFAENSLYEVISIDELGLPNQITKKSYLQFLSEFDGIIDFFIKNAPLILVSVLILFPIMGSFFMTTWYLIYLVVAVVLLWSIAQLFRTKIGYRHVYHLGLYGLSVPIMFSFIVGLLGLHVPYVFMSSYLLWMVVVLSKFKSYKRV